MENSAVILIIGNDTGPDRVGAVLRSQKYNVTSLSYDKASLQKIAELSPDVIFLDMISTETDGLDLLDQLKKEEGTAQIPVAVITLKDSARLREKAFEKGADDFLINPEDETEIRARATSLLKVKAYNSYELDINKNIESEVTKRTEQLTLAFEKVKIASLDTVYRLSRAAEYKDEDTGAHVERMSHYSSAIARAMKLNDEYIENILWAAPMHDIGKIGIPDSVLLKPGKLDDEEWVIMRQHTTIGGEILKDSDADFIKLAQDIAVSHHEKWKGGGYPNGLKGEDIPLAGRIVALADVFDALTSERPYKKAFPLEKAMAIIREDTGTHFDPDVAAAFLSIEEEIVKELNFWKFMSSDSDSGDLEADLSDLFGD